MLEPGPPGAQVVSCEATLDEDDETKVMHIEATSHALLRRVVQWTAEVRRLSAAAASLYVSQ